MGYTIIWDEEAISELSQAVRYIATRNPAAALRLGSAILERVHSLGSFPKLGKRFSKLGREDVRELPLPPYRIIYLIKDTEQCIRVLKIWHGARRDPHLGGDQLYEQSAAHQVNIQFKAIAAMSLNRVIGRGSEIPWHLPEDFKFFKQTTMGHVLIMGRKTFESIGRPLPGRETVVLSRTGFNHPGVRCVSSLNELPAPTPERQVFICGGAEIYRQTLPLCSDLHLTLVKREVDGDAYFPKFEDQFELAEEILDTPEFKIMRYQNKNLVGTRAQVFNP